MKKIGVFVLALVLSAGVCARGGGGGGGGHAGGGHASGHASGEGHSSGGVHESFSGHAEEAPHVIRPVFIPHGTNPNTVCKDGVNKVDETGSQVAVTCNEKGSGAGAVIAAIVLFFFAVIGICALFD